MRDVDVRYIRGGSEWTPCTQPPQHSSHRPLGRCIRSPARFTYSWESARTEPCAAHQPSRPATALGPRSLTTSAVFVRRSGFRVTSRSRRLYEVLDGFYARSSCRRTTRMAPAPRERVPSGQRGTADRAQRSGRRARPTAPEAQKLRAVHCGLRQPTESGRAQQAADATVHRTNARQPPAERCYRDHRANDGAPTRTAYIHPPSQWLNDMGTRPHVDL